jgi:hypothetical protein
MQKPVLPTYNDNKRAGPLRFAASWRRCLAFYCRIASYCRIHFPHLGLPLTSVIRGGGSSCVWGENPSTRRVPVHLESGWWTVSLSISTAYAWSKYPQYFKSFLRWPAPPLGLVLRWKRLGSIQHENTPPSHARAVTCGWACCFAGDPRRACGRAFRWYCRQSVLVDMSLPGKLTSLRCRQCFLPP